MVGDSGIAWALGLAHAAAPGSGRPRHGALTGELRARLRAARSAGPVPLSDDFIYGTAGMIVAHAGLLQAADAVGLTRADIAVIRDHLALLCTSLAARQAPDAATGTADGGSQHGPPRIPEQTAAPVIDYGFAHGTAGIGYGFLAGGITLSDETLIGYARQHSQQIIDAASYSGDQAWWRDGSPAYPLYRAHWCHGSSGVATFLVRLWWFTGDQAALAAARAAAEAALAGRAGAPACMCHGLAGDGELLLDLAAATGERRYADAAWSIAGQLWSLRAQRNGRWLVPDESGTGADAGYAWGSSGVAAFLLRLLHGGRRPWTADDVPHGPRRAGFPAFSSENEGR
jgi:hypothetical protein